MSFKPGELLGMAKKNPKKAYKIAQKSFNVGHVKHSGTFQGKSNALGHGGRAAQLEARGVPGGVIGNMARAAHAAPGQANFHGKKSRRAKKSMELPKQELGLALKRKASKKHKSSSKHTHIHIHMHKGSDALQGTKLEHREESGMRMKRKSSGKSREGDLKTQGQVEDRAEGHEEYKHSKKRKGAMCMKCKGAHATNEHGKKK